MKRKDILDTCHNTEDLEDFVLREMSQTPEDKYCDSISMRALTRGCGERGTRS